LPLFAIFPGQLVHGERPSVSSLQPCKELEKHTDLAR